MRKIFSLLVTMLFLSALVIGLAVFQFQIKPKMIEGFIRSAPQPVQSVAAVEAATELWKTRLHDIGTLRSTRQVDVAAQIGGIVRAIAFDTDQDVEKGAVLVEIDDAIEQADLKANLASLTNAEAVLRRQKQLQSDGAASQSALDSALAQRDSVAASVERTRAAIAQKRIVAPFSGRLGVRRIDVGQYVPPGTPLVGLQSFDPIYLDFQASEILVAELKIGQKIEARVDAYPQEVFIGAIKILDARINSETRKFLVRCEIPNKEKKLRPGMFANLTVELGEPKEAIVLPTTAIVVSLYGDSVFVVQRDASAPADRGILERRFVHVGASQGAKTSIIDGLQPGEWVVVAGQNKLRPKMDVAIQRAAAPGPLAPLPRE